MRRVEVDICRSARRSCPLGRIARERARGLRSLIVAIGVNQIGQRHDSGSRYNLRRPAMLAQ
jgi:hypothetical protein